MRIMRFLFLVLNLCLAISCHDLEKDKLSNLVKEWDGKEIEFPSHSVFTVQGKDTINFNPFNSTFKIVTYVDSEGCVSCKLQLFKWKEFIKEVASLNKNVSFVFYFYPQTENSLLQLMDRDNFTYPVCLDTCDEFNQLNHFPSDVRFQSFLLNEENKVIVIGNPILNFKIKEIYLNLLKGNTNYLKDNDVTAAMLDFERVNFGTFLKTEKQTKIVKLKNTGRKPLIIQEVNTSCGCIKVEFQKSPVPVGGEAILKIIYEADKDGYFRKNVKLYCNTHTSPIQLAVYGKAE